MFAHFLVFLWVTKQLTYAAVTLRLIYDGIFQLVQASHFGGTLIYMPDIFSKMASLCGKGCDEASSHDPDLLKILLV